MDATTYLGLGHAFPANMTGSTVLLDVAVARGDDTAGARSAVALGGFSFGVIIGALIVENRSWPAGSAFALLLESASCWRCWSAGRSPAARPQRAWYPLLGGAAAAMGLQSMPARAASGGRGGHHLHDGHAHQRARVAHRARRLPRRGLRSRAPHRKPRRRRLAAVCTGRAGARSRRSAGTAALVGPTTIVGLISASARRTPRWTRRASDRSPRRLSSSGARSLS